MFGRRSQLRFYREIAERLRSRVRAELDGRESPPDPHGDVVRRTRALALSPGWYDLAVGSPLMSTERARRELGWAPRWSSADAVRDVLDAVAGDLAGPSPVLRD